MSTNSHTPERYRLSTDKADILLHLCWSSYRSLVAGLLFSLLICSVCWDMSDGVGGIGGGNRGGCFGNGFLFCSLSFCHFRFFLIPWEVRIENIDAILKNEQ